MINKMENKNDVTMEKNYTVYMHVSPNGKRYIGITRNKPKLRWANGLGYKHNEYFWRAIQKYEWNNFEHIIIENNLTKEQAENMEIELIAKYRSDDRECGYNIESGGNCKGKASDETRKKMSEAQKGENNPNAKKVYCDEMIFECVLDCENYYNVNRGTMKNWLNGKVNMNEDFQKLNLRYATKNDLNECEKYDINKHGDKASIVININNGNFVHCDNLIFKSVQNCANYYNVKNITMTSWLKGKNKMPLDFQKLNLRYATKNDLNECEKYDINKHGDKASIVINLGNFIHCDNLIFNSIAECANYYGIKYPTMNAWLNGRNKMPVNFQQLNLRYATNEDLNTYQRYTPVNN